MPTYIIPTYIVNIVGKTVLISLTLVIWAVSASAVV
jgi:hypothetical protein